MNGLLRYCLCISLLILPCSNARLFAETNSESSLKPTEKTDKGKSDSKESDKDSKGKKDKEKEDKEPIKAGNLSLPSSQQPGPLVGIGENIIGKGQTQFFFFADAYEKKHGYFHDIFPAILYGLTDNLSIFFNVPASLGYKERNTHSSGLEDLFVQLEYAYYNKTEKTYSEQATVLANVTLPTGDGHAMPPTGFDAPGFTLGTTYNYTGIDWFYFTCYGAILPIANERTRFGSQYLYEWGLGRNIASSKTWILSWMVEIDGFYSLRNRIDGVVDPNSGGNVVFVTPSIWYSTEKLIFQLGAGCPLTQHLNGNQSRFTYQVILNVGWTF